MRVFATRDARAERPQVDEHLLRCARRYLVGHDARLKLMRRNVDGEWKIVAGGVSKIHLSNSRVWRTGVSRTLDRCPRPCDEFSMIEPIASETIGVTSCHRSSKANGARQASTSGSGEGYCRHTQAPFWRGHHQGDMQRHKEHQSEVCGQMRIGRFTPSMGIATKVATNCSDSDAF